MSKFLLIKSVIKCSHDCHVNIALSVYIERLPLRLRVLQTKAKSHTINNLLTSNVRSLRGNFKPRLIAQSIRQRPDLRFSRKYRTFEVNKLLTTYITPRVGYFKSIWLKHVGWIPVTKFDKAFYNTTYTVMASRHELLLKGHSQLVHICSLDTIS